ncbi:P-loop NTPase fold protein [Streptomyces sp. NPDC008137]|uniref:KAP family P-loop NTPase fold protein n=1 Tax=Streptomyces sp. NPDC008137 TaxID=3364813 RepID=UPI0036E1B7C5
MRPLTDNPVGEANDDAFGFMPYVRVLHEAVAEADPLPLTVGVFGAWGTGKSSFLSLWQGIFDEGKDRTIWFNPWKYDRKVEVWAALLHTILAEMEQEERLREKVGRLARAATWLSMRAGLGTAASLATGGVINGTHVNEILDTFSQADSEEYRQVNAFEHDFADAVNEFVGPDGRLVVFVDDLDRCTPDAAVTVLESLKLFLGESRCVFVLALDLDVVAAVATKKFGEALAGAPGYAAAGMEYLDKIVQLPFFLPDVEFQTLRASLSRYVGQELADSGAFWELIQVGLGTNPRRVKRFLNVLNLSALTYAPANDGPLDRHTLLQLAELLIIRTRHRAFFHLLTEQPGAWRALEGYATSAIVNPRQEAMFRQRLDPGLVGFTSDDKLMRLLQTGPGVYNDHPAAPDGDQVTSMISTLRRTAGPDDTAGTDPV